MSNTIKLAANDTVGSGQLEASFSIGGGGIVSPFGLEFVRQNEDGSKSVAGFAMTRQEAKRLAAFILQHL